MHPEWEHWHLNGQNKTKTRATQHSGKSTLCRHNIIQSICSVQHYISNSCEKGKCINRHTYSNKLNSTNGDFKERKVDIQ